MNVTCDRLAVKQGAGITSMGAMTTLVAAEPSILTAVVYGLYLATSHGLREDNAMGLRMHSSPAWSAFTSHTFTEALAVDIALRFSLAGSLLLHEWGHLAAAVLVCGWSHRFSILTEENLRGGLSARAWGAFLTPFGLVKVPLSSSKRPDGKPKMLHCIDACLIMHAMCAMQAWPQVRIAKPSLDVGRERIVQVRAVFFSLVNRVLRWLTTLMWPAVRWIRHLLPNWAARLGDGRCYIASTAGRSGRDFADSRWCCCIRHGKMSHDQQFLGLIMFSPLTPPPKLPPLPVLRWPRRYVMECFTVETGESCGVSQSPYLFLSTKYLTRGLCSLQASGGRGTGRALAKSH